MRTTSSTPVTATLHLVCGKIASGKSTLTARLAEAPKTVRSSDAQFDDITRHFVPPSAEEGFDSVRIAA